jgi:hypothetical protein
MSDVHALLVEGVPGIGKSTVIEALIRRHVASADKTRIRTLLHLSQTWTYGPLAPGEDAGTLTARENLELLDRIVRSLEWLSEDVRVSGPPCFVLIEALHLTHCVRPGVLSWSDAAPIDRRLAAVGCRLLLLRGRRETIRERSIERRAGTEFLKYARRFGGTAEELEEHFVGEQARFEEMFAGTAMAKKALVNDGRVEDTIDEAYQFWREKRPPLAA